MNLDLLVGNGSLVINLKTQKKAFITIIYIELDKPNPLK